MRTVTARIEALERKHPAGADNRVVIYDTDADGVRTYTTPTGEPLSQAEVLDLDCPILLPAKS